MLERIRHAVPLAVLLAACLVSCGLPLSEIRSAAQRGDVQAAVRLAEGELEGFRAAGLGTLDRLAAEAGARAALVGALDAAPPAAEPVLEAWATADSGVDEPTRTFARARLSEMRGGAFADQLRAAQAAGDPGIRALALRGLLPTGPAQSDLLEALADAAPAVSRVAAQGLAAAAEREGGLVPNVLQTVRARFADHPDPATRAALAGALDPSRLEDQQALVRGLADEAPAVRIAAAAVLGRLADPRSVPEVAALLDGPPSPAGLALAIEAGKHGAAAVRDAFVARVLGEAPPDDPLRVGAVLGMADDEAARETWSAMVDRGGPRVAVAACERLLAAGRESERCRERLRSVVASGADADSSLGAAELLYEDRDPLADGWMRSYAVGEDPAVRRRVMQVAAARRFDPGLLAIGLADPDPAVAACAAVSALRAPDPDARPGVAP
jgi:hypothetical protein